MGGVVVLTSYTEEGSLHYNTACFGLMVEDSRQFFKEDENIFEQEIYQPLDQACRSINLITQTKKGYNVFVKAVYKNYQNWLKDESLKKIPEEYYKMYEFGWNDFLTHLKKDSRFDPKLAEMDC